MKRLAAMAAGAALMVLGVVTPSHSPQAAEQARPSQQQRTSQAKPQRGNASFYAKKFHGRRMANGRRFDERSNSAAHRTLPLGTTARVTNLANGRTAVVKVEDRGPFVRNRVIDLSPSTARNLGMQEQGVAPVEVTPLQIPDRNERLAER